MATLLVVGMMTVPIFTAARPAYAVDLACQVTGSYNNIGPDTPGGGVEGLLPRVALWDKNPQYVVDGAMPHDETAIPATKYTLWELNGTSGLLWSTSGKDVNNKDSCSVWNTTLSQVAQIIFEVPRFVVSVTNSLQEMAVANRPVTPLLDELDGGHSKNQGVVSQIFRWVTLPGAVIALVATGFWILTRTGRRNRDAADRHDREILDGIVWAVGATALVLFLLIGNMWRTYLDAGDRAVGEFNSAVNSALLPGMGATGPCSLPDNVENRGERVAICNFYRAFAFDPWARGQFGSAGGERLVGYCMGDPALTLQAQRDNYKSYLNADKWDIRMFQVEAQSYNLNDWYLIRHGSHNAVKRPPGSVQYSPWAAVQKQMQGKVKCTAASAKHQAQYAKAASNLTAYYGDWQGTNGFQRIGTALSDALLSILCALPPFLASMMAFMFQILAWLAIFALPIVGVAGIFPPFRRWLTSLLQILLASYFTRIAFGVALTMTQLAYGIVFSSPFPFGVQILILLVIVVAAVHLIRAVREAGLTSSWSRAMHGSAVGMAGAAGRQSGQAVRLGRTMVAGVAGGVAGGMAASATEERRSRRNTGDRPMGRGDGIRRDGEPQVASRRRSTGVVIAADGTTSERRRGDGPESGRVPEGGGPRPTHGGAGRVPEDQPSDGPQVARRLRREEPEPAPQGARNQSARNQGAGPQPAVVSTNRVETTTVRRRQEASRVPDQNPKSEPVVTDQPPPTARRQGDRSRFVDPEP